MKKKWKLILGAAIVLLGAGVAFAVTLQGVPAQVLEVEPGELSVSFTEDGRVRPHDARERTVYSAYPAPIARLAVQEGDRVSAGQTLAVLDDTELVQGIKEVDAHLHGVEGKRRQLDQQPGAAELASVDLAIAQAEAEVKTARRHLERTWELYEQGLVSKAELEEAEDGFNTARNHLRQQKNSRQVLIESYRPAPGSQQVLDAERRALEAQRELLQYQRGQYTLAAPISGVVAEVQVEEGAVVGPQVPVLRLFQEESYRIETEVLDRDVTDIATGMLVNLTFEARHEDIEFTGEVVDIAPEAQETVSPLGLEEERVTVTINPFVPDDLRLAPGFRVEVEFITRQEEAQMVVPKTALFTVDGEDALLVVRDGRARARRVETGLETRTDVAIVAGLREGEQVIVDPERDGIEEGDRIDPR